MIEKQSNQQIPYGQIGSVSNLTFFAGGFDIIAVFFTETKFHFKYIKRMASVLTSPSSKNLLI